MSFACLAVLLLSDTLVHAFDSGHHLDLINNALTLKGYGGLAISIAQERAWFVEYFGIYATNVNQTSANAGS